MRYVGLSLAWLGGSCGSYLAALQLAGANTRSVPLVWLTSTFLLVTGVALLSGGSFRPRAVLYSVRTVDRTMLFAAGGAAIVASLAARPMAVAAGSGGARSAILMAILQVVLAGLYLLSRRHEPGSAETAVVREWLLPSTGIAAFLAVSAITSALALPDTYPVSRYPMYAAERADPYELEQVVFVAVDADGTETALPRPAARQTLLSLAQEGDQRRLEALAGYAARSRSFEGAVEVRSERLRFATYPDAVQARVVDSEVVWRGVPR